MTYTDTTTGHTARTTMCTAPAIRMRDVELGYGGRRVVGPVDLDIPRGLTTVIIGANGCGKSTLLRGLTRQIPLMGGAVELLGEDTRRIGAREYARTVALLPQSPIVPEHTTVAQLVERGRYPHRSWFGARSRQDEAAIAEAVDQTGLVDLLDRDVAELSGGQRQRAWLALVLAQRTPIVLLDEPMSFLDMSHQVELLDLIRSLRDPTVPGHAPATAPPGHSLTAGETATPVQGEGVSPRATVVAVLHELSLAARCADHIIAVHDGAIAAQGAPADVITPAVLHEVFGLHADVIPDPLLGHPVVLPRTAKETQS